MSNSDLSSLQTKEPALTRVVSLLAVGLAGIIIYSLKKPSWAFFCPTFGTIFLIAGAALLMGALLGLLFGIPRSLQRSPEEESNATSDLMEGGSRISLPGVGYLANTNLEQISDWLTKILVGVGLTQITTIPSKLEKLARYAVNGSEISSTFVMAVIIWFSVCGFLYGYLWARLSLGYLLKRADVEALGIVEQRTARIEFQRQAEDTAIKFTEILLDTATPPDLSETDLKEFKESLKNSSKPIRAQIFDKAREFRSRETKKERGNVRRTIPIFQALIETDINNETHRYHGELGFALKDQTPPSWKQAISELTKAIEIRDRKGMSEHRSWRLYELNRAICRIKSEGKYKGKKRSDPDVFNQILGDLTMAHKYALKPDEVFKDESVREWMKINEIEPSKLDNSQEDGSDKDK